MCVPATPLQLGYGKGWQNAETLSKYNRRKQNYLTYSPGHLWRDKWTALSGLLLQERAMQVEPGLSLRGPRAAHRPQASSHARSHQLPRCPPAPLFRTRTEQLERVKRLLPESQCQNLAVTVLYMPYSRDTDPKPARMRDRINSRGTTRGPSNLSQKSIV